MAERGPDGGKPADLLIVGAGAAGVAAAIEAAEAGLQVVVLEAFPQYGGAAATSGGGCCLVDTPLQRRLGIADSVALAMEDWRAWSEGTADLAWAALYLERSVPDLYRWAEQRGVEWIAVQAEEGNSVPRWHRPKGGGEGLMRALYGAARRLPITWRFSCEVEEIVREAAGAHGEGDGLLGALARTPDGRLTVHARAILVATGGFNNNPAMLDRYAPDPGPGSRLLAGGARQARGTGHDLLRRAGAEMVHLDWIWMYPFATPDYRDETGRRGLVVRGLANDIWVNAQGRRFHDESRRGGKTGLQAVWAQVPRTCWAIFDRAEADRLVISDPCYRREDLPDRPRIERLLAESPYVHCAPAVGELARRAGLPAAALVETVQQWNSWLSAEEDGPPCDPAFGRPRAGLRPIDRPPYFAMQFFPLARKNFGGVRTDLGGRVLRPGGSPIPGLYAAGEVAGMAGGFINGRWGLEGTMLGPSLFSGRVAARTAAADLKASPRPFSPA